MKKNKTYIALTGAMLPFLTGCGIVRITVLSVAAVIGLAGYAVYKTGEGAVTGVKKFVSKTGQVASGTSKAAGTILFFKGNFKTEYPYGIRFVWISVNTACSNAMFTDIKGSVDALSGSLTAKTRTGTEIKISLKNVESNLTKASIRYGVKGNMAESEKINNFIVSELKLMQIQAVQSHSTTK